MQSIAQRFLAGGLKDLKKTVFDIPTALFTVQYCAVLSQSRRVDDRDCQDGLRSCKRKGKISKKKRLRLVFFRD
jgi:hypothetical protein